MKACNFIKKRIQHRCFLEKFAKFLRTSILKNICEWLLASLGSIFPLFSLEFPLCNFNIALREKCPHSEFIWSVFFHIQSKCGKYGPEELRMRTLFTQWWLLKAVLRRSYTERFVWYDLYDFYSVLKSLHTNLKRKNSSYLLKTVSCKFWCRNLLRFSSLQVQISRIIQKPNKSHTNRIIQIVPCKTTITRNNLYDAIYMTLIRF